MHRLFFVLVAFLVGLSSCSSFDSSPKLANMSSPEGIISVDFFLSEDGQPHYTVSHQETMVIDTSGISFDFRDAPSLGMNMEITSIDSSDFEENWEMVWGEQDSVLNKYRELRISLVEGSSPGREMNLVFRVYDDGIGFRYEFPEQSNWDGEVVIMDENTQFQLTGDHTAWWIPGDWDIYEHLYNTTRVSEIDAIAKRDHPNLAQTYIPENAVNTPVTMRTDEGLYLSFHEANLTDYSGMTLKVNTETLLLESELVGSRDSSKVKRTLPFHTPWRTLQIAEKPGDLIESKLIVNLNEPNKLGKPDWIRPIKYIGIWWEMHLGKSSWDMASGKHGATTENAKRHIDFAAKNNIDAVLVEGWNTGWERWIGFPDREGVFDFITPYPDYDLEGVVAYGKQKGVDIIMHHETSAAPRTYEQQLDTAFALLTRLGIHAIKSGYVGKIIPEGEYHHGQWMVNHYRKVLLHAAKHKVMMNVHEPIKATGIRRTYPNMVTREGLRGQEFNAWSNEGGNPTEHLAIVPFTRMLSGPIDFTPGIFDIKFEDYPDRQQVNTTLAQQLALYVVLYSPMQMAADLLENYEGNPAFQFIRDVALDWSESNVLNAEIGEYITIARKEKDSDDWFLGSLTNEDPREFDINLDFLDEEKSYKASIYADTPDSHWDNNPTEIQILVKRVKKGDNLKLTLAPGGGTAIHFKAE